MLINCPPDYVLRCVQYETKVQNQTRFNDPPKLNENLQIKLKSTQDFIGAYGVGGRAAPSNKRHTKKENLEHNVLYPLLA